MLPTAYPLMSYWISLESASNLGVCDAVPGSVFFYAPNKGAAIFGTIAFAVSTGIHVWQCLYAAFTMPPDSRPSRWPSLANKLLVRCP
jgi:hypothetical protein